MRNESKQSALVKSLTGLMAVITVVMIVGVVVLRQTQQQREKEVYAAQIVEQEQIKKGEGLAPTFAKEKTIAQPYSMPQTMTAAQIKPGREFLTDLGSEANRRKDAGETKAAGLQDEAWTDSSSVKEEIRDMVNNAQAIGLDTLFVTLNNPCGIIGSQEVPMTNFDVLGMLHSVASSAGIQLYGVYDLSLCVEGDSVVPRSSVDAQVLDSNSRQLSHLAESGLLDGILLDGYLNEEDEMSYAQLVDSGENYTLDQYMTQSTSLLVKDAADTFRKNGLSAGLAVDAVWATAQEREGGIEVEAEDSALGQYHADTKAMIENDIVDFVVVKNYSCIDEETLPFADVSDWWSELMGHQDIPVYMGFASSKAEEWDSDFELADQWEIMDETEVFSGSVYDSLDSLAQDTLFIQELHSTWNQDKAFQEEDMNQKEPEQKPMDEETKQHAANTLDKLTAEIPEGFVPYSEKTDFYSTRVLADMDPAGYRSVAHGDTVQIRAFALPGSTVTAQINGETIPLKETDRRSSISGYKRYEGKYIIDESKITAPLGRIVVTAVNGSDTAALTGALLEYKCDGPLPWERDETTAPSKPENDHSNNTSGNGSYSGELSYTKPKLSVSDKAIGNGTLVQVVADQALTFPTYKNSIYPDTNCYPMPYGTMDRVVGSKISIKDGKSYRHYYKLESGRRVYCDDVKAVSGISSIDNNHIRNMTVKANKDFTYVILQSDYPVAYLPEYLNGKIRFHFQNTVSTPGDLSLNSNPLFSSAKWNGSTLELNFLNNGFLGYKGYHENGNIVLRFNNPTGIKGANIVVDPGHGGDDPGVADNIDPNWLEKRVNWELSKEITKALQAKGADVTMLNTYEHTTSLDSRLDQAKNVDAVMFLCIHTNASENASAVYGSECYYFYPFSKNLATKVSAATAAGLSTKNRGSKYDVFYVNRDPQFVSVLSETGFLTNPAEYSKLKQASYRQSVGEEVADAVEEFLQSVGTRYVGRTGTQSTGPALNASNGPYTGKRPDPIPGIDNRPEDKPEEEKPVEKPESKPEEKPESKPEEKPESKPVPHKPVPETVYSEGKKDGYVKYIIFTDPQDKRLDLEVGDKKQLGVRLSGDQDVRKKYVTSNRYVAMIDANGVITATGPGTCKITVVAGDQGGTITVKVSGSGYYIPSYPGAETPETVNPTPAPAPAPTPAPPSGKDPVPETVYSSGNTDAKVKYITFTDPTSQQLTLSVGEDHTLGVRITGDQSAQKKYTTSNRYVAAINSDGVITATGPGTCTIRVVAGNQGGTINVKVTGSGTITPPASSQKAVSETTYSKGNADGKVKYIILTDPADKQLNLSIGQAKELGIRLSGDQSTQKKYTTSNRNVARIDSNGIITAVGPGSCKIHVVAGNQGASITVNVAG